MCTLVSSYVYVYPLYPDFITKRVSRYPCNSSSWIGRPIPSDHHLPSLQRVLTTPSVCLSWLSSSLKRYTFTSRLRRPSPVPSRNYTTVEPRGTDQGRVRVREPLKFPRLLLCPWRRTTKTKRSGTCTCRLSLYFPTLSPYQRSTKPPFSDFRTECSSHSRESLKVKNSVDKEYNRSRTFLHNSSVSSLLLCTREDQNRRTYRVSFTSPTRRDTQSCTSAKYTTSGAGKGNKQS